MPTSPENLDPRALVAIFYENPSALGELSAVEPGDLPDAYRRLLVHEEHMTVAMEACYESLVDVDTHYARKILLRRQTDGAVVQFGIMRVNLTLLADDVCAEIRQATRPLGRILVRHNLMRTVHLDQLWKVSPGDDLRQLFNVSDLRPTYGRSAGIDIDGVPAVEVLEIAAPLV